MTKKKTHTKKNSVRNPKTGRLVFKDGTIAAELRTSNKKRKSCKGGIRNPATRNCVRSKEGKKNILKCKKEKKYYNHFSDRCVGEDTPTGIALFRGRYETFKSLQDARKKKRSKKIMYGGDDSSDDSSGDSSGDSSSSDSSSGDSSSDSSDSDSSECKHNITCGDRSSFGGCGSRRGSFDSSLGGSRLGSFDGSFGGSRLGRFDGSLGGSLGGSLDGSLGGSRLGSFDGSLGGGKGGGSFK